MLCVGLQDVHLITKIVHDFGHAILNDFYGTLEAGTAATKSKQS